MYLFLPMIETGQFNPIIIVFILFGTFISMALDYSGKGGDTPSPPSLIRPISGTLIGIYIAQTYDLPKLNVVANKVQDYLKSIEKNNGKNNGKND